MVYRIIILLTWIIWFGCTRHSTDARLEHISQIVSDNPQQALVCLDSINRSHLSDADSHYYDFLTIKSRDKAFIKHTSDSLILSVIDYFEGTDLYPETLYYGGRVYSDMGDYPTALQYFHKALELLPSGTENAVLRGCVLGQTGSLLSNLQMLNDALPYLKDCVELSIELNDTVNIPYDYQLLGSIYSDLNDYDSEHIYITKAYDAAKRLTDEDKAFAQGYLAMSFYHKDQMDSALYYINGVPERVWKQDREYFEACAVKIYFKAGEYDMAIRYAKKCIASKDYSYRINGYRRLLSPKLRDRINSDSLYTYYENYLDALEKQYRSHNAESTIHQNSFYNYSVHQRKSAEMTKSRMKLIIWLSVAAVVILALTCVIILRQRILLKKQATLQSALHTISELNRKLNNLNNYESRESVNSPESSGSVNSPESIEGLQDMINEEIIRLKKSVSNISVGHNEAVETEAYHILIELLEKGAILKDTDPLWATIYDSVRALSPEFELTLKRLSGNKLTMQDYRLAVLIKLGLSSSQIGQLIGRTKSAVMYRRKQFCSKVFNNRIDTNELNAIIRHL